MFVVILWTRLKSIKMEKSILMIGGTGYLGGKVIDHLLERHVNVSALVREGSDKKSLEEKGVHIITGDLTKFETILRPLKNFDAVISTAIGYSQRRPGDTLKSVDDRGNRNLVDALKSSKVQRFVFTSILTADKAISVPHFWQKELIEDYMDTKKLPYISLRPGAFLDQNPVNDQYAKSLRKGTLMVIGTTSGKWTHILTDDLAKYLAIAAIDENIPNGKIDIGMNEPMNARMLAKYASEYTGTEIKVSSVPWFLVGPILKLGGIFSPKLSDLRKMFKYFFSGQYVANTELQQKYFGEVPTVRDSVFRYCKQIGLAAKAN